MFRRLLSTLSPFCKRIGSCKNLLAVRQILEEAEKSDSCNSELIASAIKRVMSNDIRNPKFAYDLIMKIPRDHYFQLDAWTLSSILNCASKAKDTSLAQFAFSQLKEPDSVSFYHLIESFHGKDRKIPIVQLLESRVAEEPFVRFELIGVIIKSCKELKDFHLAKRAWEWSNELRQLQPRGSEYVGSTIVTYLSLCSKAEDIASIKELWKETIKFELVEKPQIITAFMEGLSFDPDEQGKLLEGIISKDPCARYDGGVVLSMLRFCTRKNDQDLARRVWSWSDPIRVRTHATPIYFILHFHYYSITHAPGPQIVDLWNEICACGLSDRKELFDGMIWALRHHPSELEKFKSDNSTRGIKETDVYNALMGEE